MSLINGSLSLRGKKFLPNDTRRKDSALNDKGNNGEDLTGGYYDGKPPLGMENQIPILV